MVAGAESGPQTHAAALALLRQPGVGDAALRTALHAAEVLGRPLDSVLTASYAERIGWPPAIRAEAGTLPMLHAEDLEAARGPALELERLGARLVFLGEADYPARALADLGGRMPPMLTLFGNPGLLDQACTGVVGARKASEAGIALAKRCGHEAAVWGPIVSGGAEGVDLAAHEAAIEVGGATIVVLPQGLLTYQPPKFIRDAVAAGRAVLVSSFAPDMPWRTHAAVARNEIISALSRIVCVIEPRRMGGSVRTARHAMARGKPVFVHIKAREHALGQMLLNGGAKEINLPLGDFHLNRLKSAFFGQPEGPPQPDLL